MNWIATALGTLRAQEEEGSLSQLVFTEEEGLASSSLLAEEIAAYFRGELTRFKTPLARRGTPFQQQVWQALLEIPYGTTCSYKDIAHIVGRPSAVRAVANAVGANPWTLIVPCHRVVYADGALGGYAWGSERKRRLIDHEALFW
jgi:methylated-DNA-[protein]-cysteine S-methyltransferase